MKTKQKKLSEPDFSEILKILTKYMKPRQNTKNKIPYEQIEMFGL